MCCLLVLWWVDNCLFPPGSSLSALFMERRRVNIVGTGGAQPGGTYRLFTQSSLEEPLRGSGEQEAPGLP